MAMPPEPHNAGTNSVPAPVDQYGVRYTTAPSVPTVQQGEIVPGSQQLTGQTMAMPSEPYDSALVDQYGVRYTTAPSVPDSQQLTGQTMAMPSESHNSVP